MVLVQETSSSELVPARQCIIETDLTVNNIAVKRESVEILLLRITAYYNILLRRNLKQIKQSAHLFHRLQYRTLAKSIDI